MDFLSFNTSLSLAYGSLQSTKIETSASRRMLFDFQEKKKVDKRKEKRIINTVKGRFQNEFLYLGWGSKSQTVLFLQHYRTETYEQLLHW